MSRIITTKPRPGAKVDRGNPINRGLIGWWLFNEGAGSRLADIASQNHGVLTNMDPATAWVGSLHGGSLKFDGSNNYVDLGVTFNFPEYTYSSWVKTADASGNKYIFSEGTITGRLLGVLSGSPAHWQLWSNVLEGTSVADDDLWTNVVVTYDGTTARLYADGVEEDSNNITPGTGTGARIGSAGSGFNWDGEIDDFRIYNRALTAAEVQQLYDSTYGGILRRRLNFVPAVAAAAFIPDNRFRRFAPLLAQ